MISSVLISILFFTLWIYFLWSRRKYYILWFKLGGPPTLPIIGDLNIIKHEQLLTVIKKCREKYGTLCVSWAGIFPLLYVGNPDDAKSILTSPDCIEKSLLYKGIDIGLGTPGLITSKNPTWSQHRKILAPAYSVKKLMSYTSIFNKQTDILVHETFRNEALKNKFVNIEDLLMNCFLGITMETTMGTRMDVQQRKSNGIMEAYKTILVKLADLVFDVKYFNKFFYKFAPFRKVLQEAVDFQKSYIKKVVEAKLTGSSINFDWELNDTAETFIDNAIKSYKEQKFSMEDVYSESLTVIMASFETVTRALFHTCVCLALYPEYQEKLFNEIISVYPDKHFSTDLDEVKKLPFLHMCFQEAMRFIPIVPLIGRRSTKDVNLGNVIVPAGVEIAVDIMSIHHDPNIWGDDVDKFNPYRFLPEEEEKRHPYSFLPFSRGPRQCMGIQYAYFVCKMLLMKIIRNYHLTIDMEYKDFKYKQHLVLHFEKNPKFHLRLREE